jgi:hypothetical protein
MVGQGRQCGASERVDILSLGCLPQIVRNMCAWFGIMDHDLGPK